MRDPLTEKQQAVLDFITGYIDMEGVPPTREDIAAHFGMTGAGALSHLRALQTKGYIVIPAGKKRAMRIIK